MLVAGPPAPRHANLYTAVERCWRDEEGDDPADAPLLPEAQHHCSPRRRHRGDDPEPPEASRSQAVLASEERVMDAFATGAIRLGGDQAECGGGYPPPPRRVRSLRPGERRRESCRRSWRLRSASWTRLPRAPRPSARLKTRCKNRRREETRQSAGAANAISRAKRRL